MVESFVVNGELTVTIILLKVISSKLNTPGQLEGSPLHRAVMRSDIALARGSTDDFLGLVRDSPLFLGRWAGEK